MNMLDDVLIYNDPYGVVLCIGPWNYPIQLSIIPLAAAIAGGNTVILKPSELAEACSMVMAELLPKYIDSVSLYIIMYCIVIFSNNNKIVSRMFVK